MARNAARRDELLDAGLIVLARQGARGLTFRAVDAEAKVATGTSSNYFPDRDKLFAELGERIYTRLAPTDAELAAVRQPTGPEVVPGLMRALLARVLSRHDVYVALLELRLEATRRPCLRTSLTATVRSRFDADVAVHEDAGFPGGRRVVELLHHVMEGLILDQLTLPDALPSDDPGHIAELLAEAVMAAHGVGGLADRPGEVPG